MNCPSLYITGFSQNLRMLMPGLSLGPVMVMANYYRKVAPQLDLFKFNQIYFHILGRHLVQVTWGCKRPARVPEPGSQCCREDRAPPLPRLLHVYIVCINHLFSNFLLEVLFLTDQINLQKVIQKKLDLHLMIICKLLYSCKDSKQFKFGVKIREDIF